MKTAYEIALEKYGKSEPVIKLTEEQKKQIAELEKKYKAKIAEKEIVLKEQINKAKWDGNYEEAEKLERQLAEERKALLDELEDEKEKIRKQTETKKKAK